MHPRSRWIHQMALKALCKACMVPENVTAHLVAMGFVSVAFLGHAISDVKFRISLNP